MGRQPRTPRHQQPYFLSACCPTRNLHLMSFRRSFTENQTALRRECRYSNVEKATSACCLHALLRKTVITVLLRDFVAQFLNSYASSGVFVAQPQPEPICCVLGRNLGVPPVVTGRAVMASGWALRRASAFSLPFCRLSL